MLNQARAAQRTALRPAMRSQRRLLATPPPPSQTPVGTHVRSPAVPISTPGSSTVAAPPVPPSSTGRIPLPPPNAGRRPPRRFFRRFLIYTTLGLLTFYPASGWLSTQYEGYRDFFVDTFPGGEFVADYADDHNWETFGAGSVSKKAVQGWQKVTGEEHRPGSTKEEAAAKFREMQKKAEAAGKKVEAESKQALREVESKAQKAVSAVKGKTEDVKDAAKSEGLSLRERAAEAADKMKSLAADARAQAAEVAADAKAKAAEATAKATGAAQDATAKVAGAVPAMPRFSDGVEDVVQKAEEALGRGESKVENAASKVKGKIEETPGPRGYLDAQRPRELRPETVTPKKPTYEGKSVYTGPALPVGHEPPPGYYIAPPVVQKVKEGVEKVKETLPLLAPKVKEFASSEPIVSQLASTIDSLASSLSTPNSSDSNKILTRAQDDLTALSKRLDDVKKAEKEKLEKTVGEKTKEFEALLKGKEQERSQGEQGLKAGWEKEKAAMVNDWRKSLETELEGQREGIEKRLREEVVSQGIELQRRWLRSIKSQVETERGGRLAKLDHLTTSLKQLERITLDNSATLDDNVRLHKVWSALRAVQAKAESGDVAFDDELRLLQSLSTPEGAQPGSVVSVTLNQLEQSGIAQTGVKSFAALASWFSNSVSPRVHSASLVPAPEEASVMSHVASATFSKLMFTPKAALIEGDDVTSTLARAEWCLGEKDLDGAAREINSLKGWPGKLAADWLREARRRLEVQQALEVVGAEATLGSLLLV